jgi:hypothetical protein
VKAGFSIETSIVEGKGKKKSSGFGNMSEEILDFF